MNGTMMDHVAPPACNPPNPLPLAPELVWRALQESGLEEAGGAP